MVQWLMENIGSLILGAILVLIVVLIIRKMIRDKREGRSSCGCGCSTCGSSCSGCTPGHLDDKQ